MKTIYLLRHAKSDRGLALEDSERALNERGRRAAPLMGAEMARRGYVPEHALVSTAERTRQTWDLIAPALGSKISAEFHEDLYLAPASRLLAHIHALDKRLASVLLVGHNPGVEDLASRLASDKQSTDGSRALQRMRAKFPTCGLAVLSFDISEWRRIHARRGVLVAFVTPATLDD